VFDVFDLAGDYLVTSYEDQENNPFLILWRITWE
jgi:hypothetical protein